ncbi:MAG: tetratricopeptide repeat protein [Candidatus Obscuribacterales bacterium]
MSISIVLIVPAVSSPASDDLVARAKLLYESGDFKKAEQCLESQIKAHPKDAVAHYILGNVFVSLKRNGDAKKEYEKAAALDPQGLVAKYSKMGLSNLANPAPYRSAMPQAGSPAQEQASDLLREKSAPERRSTEHEVTSNASADQERITAERDSKIGEIQNDTQRRIDQIKSQMQSEIEGNGRALRARGRYYYDPTDANDEIKKGYQPQIDAIKADSEKRIQALRDEYARKLGHW